jgi:hypothetical protein
LNKTKAAHYAYHTFPEDGQTLDEIANQIFKQEQPQRTTCQFSFFFE